MNQLIKKVVIGLGTVVIVVSLMGCDSLFPPAGDLVERVSDGDTVALIGTDNQKFTVRFACVDAPEVPHSKKEKSSRQVRDMNQFNWGVKAQTRVEELIKQSGNRVKLNIIESDRYGRKVAEVRLKDGTLVQQILLQEGLAKVYRPYLSKCPSKDIVQQAETQAQQQKIGVWSDKKFVDPWEYRKLSKVN
ncbi:thermonuclease family protein [Anabaena sphaerica FACHB-251]|uniref:Thermonuclease family protein n=1 Tax=Anabaena sphaerica FACHB-251 TaxID=2692883 RepID=A0A926WHA5_9NOST|nr:thermonuclease family protein [Anabaena sphaerica]MBD2294468.1 thermonuclease family protein [Anabaena sphaerica FACHB-251]